jgi:hypothetical protein
LGTVRVWVRHPVSAGASPMIAIATACFILMSTNFKYIFPGSDPLAGAVTRPLLIISIRFGCF